MMTNFALSLSIEGIELMHRVQGGWRRLGRTQISSPALDADLTELRQKAIALAPEGVTTKLVIPRDQIKYTSIDSTQTTDADVHAALDGATPYALHELVIDCERFGGRTHIAAVSRDTLKEAEAFATAHGFRPVAFVAVPDPFTFQSEVFFGPTDAMPSILGANATVTRDDLPVMIVGTRIKSRLLVMDDNAMFQDADTLADLMADHVADAVEDPAPEPEPQNVHLSFTAPEPAVVSVSADDYRIEDFQDPVVAPEIQDIWVDRVPPEHHTPVTVAAAANDDAAVQIVVPTEPLFAILPLLDRVIPEVYPALVARPVRAKPTLVATAPATAAIAAPAAPRRSQPATAQKRMNPLLVAASVAALVAALGGFVWSQMSGDDLAVVPDTGTNPIVVASTAPTAAPEPTSGSGPIIPALVITGFGAAEVGAAPQLDPVTQDQVISVAPQAIAQVAADALPVAAQAPPQAPPAEDETVAATAPQTPAVAGAVGIVPSPAEADAAYAATGVWQRSPRFLDTPSGTIALDFVSPAPGTTPQRSPQPTPPAQDVFATELPFLAPADPPPAGVVFARDADGFILATPEGTVTPEGAVVFAGLPDLSITPRPTLSQEDLDRITLLEPAPDGVVLISGRPDFATPLRPSDLVVPASPEAPEASEPATPATVGSVGLASLELQDSGAVALDSTVVESREASDLRPQLRPSRLIAPSDSQTPDITDILEGIAAEDATLRFDSSTALAVQTSLRPADRPAGFESKAATAQAQQVNSQIAAVAAAIAPVTPAAPVVPQSTGPVPGGVARAATQEDVIRLREINLIGVYGRPNARRALVRLSNGTYLRVEVGSALDGGQVTAIGDEALNYVKRGRTYAVEMPSE